MAGMRGRQDQLAGQQVTEHVASHGVGLGLCAVALVRAPVGGQAGLDNRPGDGHEARTLAFVNQSRDVALGK